MTSRISLEISRTLNLGNFESLRIQVGIEESLELGETYEDGYKRLWEILKINLAETINQNIKSLYEESPQIKATDVKGSRFRLPTVSE